MTMAKDGNFKPKSNIWPFLPPQMAIFVLFFRHGLKRAILKTFQVNFLRSKSSPLAGEESERAQK